MSGLQGAAVRVLDIRDRGLDMSFLDKLDKSSAHRQGLVDRVIVVDNTNSLVDNHIRFQRLVSLSHVRAVICVAVGPLGRDGGIALRQSAALGSAGVTLWVGDEWGSRWAGGSDRPRPITSDGASSLPDLISALSSQQVFDEVFETVRRVPHQAVCPGLAVVQPTVAATELRFLRATALDELVNHTSTAAAWPPAPAPARAHDPVDPRRDLIAGDSPLGRSKRELNRAINTVTSASAALPRFSALLLGRPRVDPTKIATASDRYLTGLDELLAQLDRQSTGQGGVDRLSGMGAPPVDPPDNPALSNNLRALVRTSLRDGHSLRELSAHLRRISNQNVPEGSASARTELASLRANLPSALRAPTPPAAWPLPIGLVAVVAALTTWATAWMTSSVMPGIGVGLLWVVLIALFGFRLPGRMSPAWRPSDSISIVSAAVLTSAGVYLGTTLPPLDIPLAGAMMVTVAGVIVALGVIGAAWRATTTGWLRGLRLAETQRDLGRLESIADDRVRDHVRTLEHRRRLSDAALLLASGATELAQLYSERAARDRTDRSTSHGPAAPELLAVLRSDLNFLTIRALDNYLYAISTGAPLATDSATLANGADRELTEYHAFLDAHSIHSPPPMVEENSAREALGVALWQQSDAGRRVLRSDGRDELVQLCQAGDVRTLNVAWNDVRVLRFAPALVQGIMLDTTAPADVITTDTDMIGVLRLVPLAVGRVVYEHPIRTDPDDPDGLSS